MLEKNCIEFSMISFTNRLSPGPTLDSTPSWHRSQIVGRLEVLLSKSDTYNDQEKNLIHYESNYFVKLQNLFNHIFGTFYNEGIIKSFILCTLQ